nr:hypothetical protein CFP56_33546 [Quercus suber]
MTNGARRWGVGGTPPPADAGLAGPASRCTADLARPSTTSRVEPSNRGREMAPPPSAPGRSRCIGHHPPATSPPPSRPRRLILHLPVPLRAALEPDQDPRVAGDHHVKHIVRAHHRVRVVAATGDRLDLGQVDQAIRQHAVGDVDRHDPADDDVDAAHRRVAGQAQGGVVLALELDRAGLDQGAVDAPGRLLVEAGVRELVHGGRDPFGGGVDGLAEVPGRHVPAELARGLGVDGAVLAPRAGVLVGREHDVGRIEGQVVELRVGGQVVDGGVLGAGRDPADGARHDASLEAVGRGSLGWEVEPSGRRGLGVTLNGSRGSPWAVLPGS